MTITREIKLSNGQTTQLSITLSNKELSEAYYEQEHNFDKQDVETELEDEDFETNYNYSTEKLTPYISEIAYLKRKYIDKYDIEWQDALHDAIVDTINKIKNETETEGETK